MTRARIAGAVLLVLLGTVLLIRVRERRESPPESPATVPQEIRADQAQTVMETVDLRNGNLHVEIPIRAARQKTVAPLSHQVGAEWLPSRS